MTHAEARELIERERRSLDPAVRRQLDHEQRQQDQDVRAFALARDRRLGRTTTTQGAAWKRLKRRLAKMEAKKITLKHPVQFGSETVTQLELKPTAGAFRGFSQTAKADGGLVYAPFDLAVVACKMAGRPNAFAEMLSPADMNRLAQEALGFLSDGLADGSEPSPS